MALQMKPACERCEAGLAEDGGLRERLHLGLIGCGGRGSWIGPYFQRHGGFKWVACADYFPERARAFAKKHGIPEANCYATLSGYKKLLDSLRKKA